MSEIKMDVWLTIAGGFAVALIAWLATYLTMRQSHSRQQSFEAKKIKQEKLEQLHKFISQYRYGIFSMMNNHRMMQLNDLVSPVIPPGMMPQPQIREPEIPDDQEIKTLAIVYAPELLEDVETLLKLGGDVCEMSYKLQVNSLYALMGAKSGEEISVESVQKSFEQLHELSERLLSKVVGLLKT